MTQQVDESGTGTEPPAQTEKAARWAAFSSAKPFAERISHWLSLIVLRIPSARAARVYRHHSSEDTFALLGLWDGGSATPAAEYEQSARRGFSRAVTLVRSIGRDFHLVCQPDGYPDWVVVVECAPVQPGELQSALEEIRWGVGWLVAAVEQVAGRDAKLTVRRLDLAVRAARAAGSARDVVSASSAVVSEVAATMPGTLVSLGVFRHNVLSLAGRAGTSSATHAEDDAKREILVRLAITQGSVVVAGALPESEAAAAAGVAPENGVRAAAFPLQMFGNCAGVLLCERLDGPGFDALEMEVLENTAGLIAPLIDLKPVTRGATVSRERRFVAGMFGPVRLKWKLALIALLAVVLFVLGATGEYDAPVGVVVEGHAPRRITAPFDGKLAEVMVRVGDGVRRGQVLARFDDAELQIEKVKLAAERDRLAQVLRAPAAEGEPPPQPTETQVARRKEIETRLTLIDDRLARLQIVSPIDGTVQAAVTAGVRQQPLHGDDPLFTIAQVDGYRIGVQAARDDLAALRDGQIGVARIGAEEVEFRILRLVPGDVDGEPVRAEAQALRMSSQIQPGMQGLGRVQVGTRKLVWIWWRRLRQEPPPA
ncbi:MAG: biotin/lipoyl-binding protein [Burkholderiales bacterium]